MDTKKCVLWIRYIQQRTKRNVKLKNISKFLCQYYCSYMFFFVNKKVSYFLMISSLMKGGGTLRRESGSLSKLFFFYSLNSQFEFQESITVRLVPLEIISAENNRLKTRNHLYPIGSWYVIESREPIPPSSNRLNLNYIPNRSSFFCLSNGAKERDKIFFLLFFLGTKLFIRTYIMRTSVV